MSHNPPVPEASQSPFPLKEPRHDHPDLPPRVRITPKPAAKPALPVGVIGALVGLGAVAIGGAIVGLRLWGTKPKPRPKRRKR